jgi:hypothetical protein
MRNLTDGNQAAHHQQTQAQRYAEAQPAEEGRAQGQAGSGPHGRTIMIDREDRELAERILQDWAAAHRDERPVKFRSAEHQIKTGTADPDVLLVTTGKRLADSTAEELKREAAVWFEVASLRDIQTRGSDRRKLDPTSDPRSRISERK